MGVVAQEVMKYAAESLAFKGDYPALGQVVSA